MAEFNNETYITDQIRKQYRNPKVSSVKASLDVKKFPMDTGLQKKIIMADVETLQAMVAKEETTYETILKAFWNQIADQLDKNAILSLDRRVFDQVKELHYDPKHDIMYGIPVLIKGNIATRHMPTNAGAAVIEDYFADDDAEIIKKLKAKGALILGKTNLSEWANFMSTESSNGYSAIGGQTKNPYGEFDVGGSSSGSAVACASHLSPVAIGTETAGSIIYPASQNSVVGLKPTLGLVSQDRIIPISKTHDTAGPMGRTVKDTYALFKAMTDNIRDPKWDKDKLKGINIGIIDNETVKHYYRDDDIKIIQRIQQELSVAKSCHFFTMLEQAFETQVYDILKYEFREGIKAYFTVAEQTTLTLDDILAFNGQKMHDYAPYNHEIIHQASTESYDPEVINSQIQCNRQMTRSALDNAFKRYDVLVTLSNYCTSVYAPAGYPAITIPAGYRTNGEPIGVTFIGQYNEDVSLMEIAYAYEQMTLHRLDPEEMRI